MLSIVMPSGVVLHVIMLILEMMNVVILSLYWLLLCCYYANSCYTECHRDECCYNEGHCGEWCGAQHSVIKELIFHIKVENCKSDTIIDTKY